ncbi:ATP-binding cassette domain-containing protein [bacterium]|nr:ATP-binding cassette domain-containing protein [bacterium]
MTSTAIRPAATASPVDTPILEAHNLTVAYREKPVLWHVDFAIRGPSLVGIIGPNGAGKSTLLKAVLGLLPVGSGHAEFFGQPLRKVRNRIGYVPQRESVDWDFPIQVLDVVLMGTYGRLGWIRRPGSAERELARNCLAKMGLEGLEHRQIGQLSGGQQQRVFLARALAQRADLYFMDEPMAGVDAATEQAIFRILAELRDQGKTVVVVHHDLRSVPERFDQLLLINQRLVAHGPTNKVFTAEILRKTYGGRLAILDELAVAVKTGQPST